MQFGPKNLAFSSFLTFSKSMFSHENFFQKNGKIVTEFTSWCKSQCHICGILILKRQDLKMWGLFPYNI